MIGGSRFDLDAHQGSSRGMKDVQFLAVAVAEKIEIRLLALVILGF